jgi:signal transduction histidine kinase
MYRLYGIHKEDFSGAFDAWAKSLAPEDFERTNAEVQAALVGEREFASEFRIVWPDNSIHYIQAASQTFRDEAGHPVRMVGVNYDITGRRQAEEELRASSERLRALSESLRKAKEEEGMRIARELHDELGSALTSLKWGLLRLDNVKSNTMTAGKAAEKIAEMVGLVDSTINTVRRISSELRPGVVDDLGLVSAIEWHAQQFQENTGIVCRFESNTEEVDLSGDQATTVFRIFQEAMTNILRHARATKANILIEQEEGGFVLEIKDNGRGITENEKLGTRSLGLLGMRERAHSVGGKVEISGAAGKGTVLTVRLPVQSSSDFKPRAGRIEVTGTAVGSLSRKEKS